VSRLQTALDALAKAKLHGSLRDGAIFVLGNAVVGASTSLPHPQQEFVEWSGTALAGAAAIFLIIRMAASVWLSEEK
jgi:hypothetical protein